VTKDELRKSARQQAAAHDAGERARDSVRIAEHIRAQPVWAESRSVLFFSPLASEPDLRSLCIEAIQRGKSVAFPKYVASSDCYEAIRILDLQKDLLPGQFGIHEPVASDPELRLKVLDLIFVPGLCFTFDGVRLGRGRGFYDRLLAAVSGKRCGAAFDWQMCNDLPVEAHDVRLDFIVTPSQWRTISVRP